ncbi:hypothetical protein [Klebsiella sp. BIGb0407]|uniref:hypothetical protein n=1 Tax=Klebsiella sp. BIGb0407 TaxID=2940603 RepID=UPI002169D693|nr:hypothetical protein [Klebsiella sp. BIGb0407]MCS3430043.1 hypothetical protein [Klebsiella sp. BIGb0407]
MKAFLIMLGLFVICLAGGIIWNAGHNNALLQTAQSEVNGQREVIAKQAFDFNRFNQVSEFTNRNNSLIDASTEKTVIEYREILRREKTCDLPVPADISDGLLDYADRLRTSAMHTDTSGTIETDNRPVTTKRLTYCQSVPWVRLLLAEAEKANNQLDGIRKIEGQRQSK